MEFAMLLGLSAVLVMGTLLGSAISGLRQAAEGEALRAPTKKGTPAKRGTRGKPWSAG